MRVGNDALVLDIKAREDDPLRASPLVRGQDVLKSSDIPDSCLEAKPRLGAGVALITAHDP